MATEVSGAACRIRAVPDADFPYPLPALLIKLAHSVGGLFDGAGATIVSSATGSARCVESDSWNGGTYGWRLELFVPRSVLQSATPGQVKELEAALSAAARENMPPGHSVDGVVLLGEAEPRVERREGFDGLAEMLILAGKDDDASWEVSIAPDDPEAERLARLSEVCDLIAFLKRFPEAILAVRAGRPKKSRGLLPRPPYGVEDEYDVQDLLWVFLKMHAPDARREDPTPVIAGSATRIDFVLASHGIGIEVKLLRQGDRIEQVKTALLRDLHDAARRPDLRYLVMFIVEKASGMGSALEELAGKHGSIEAVVVRVAI